MVPEDDVEVKLLVVLLLLVVDGALEVEDVRLDVVEGDEVGGVLVGLVDAELVLVDDEAVREDDNRNLVTVAAPFSFVRLKGVCSVTTTQSAEKLRARRTVAELRQSAGLCQIGEGVLDHLLQDPTGPA